ncbi:MAG: tRNA (guanosine(46)-N7)-methyltransferase TrmB [Streptococcaceae bacterium]|jgi:tRNA (guanine-N7-)-methyltransferase|nr:tRNA (guanosine(46)-N7)-methyltransferase TrmB [Streptococcaceae bacterium]
MRVRKRKGVEDYLKAHEDIVLQEVPESWEVVFGNAQPIEIEVGCGKGDFILGMARKHPDVNFIGIDLQETVISWALDKVLAADVPNVRLLFVNGKDLGDYFPEHSVSRLYLNFSDPWPKKRHAKRRLTSSSFLHIYEELLVPFGEIAFKTDNQGLFEWSLAEMSEFGLILEQVWLNCHADPAFAKENVETEYERKFSAKGQAIYRVLAHFPKREGVRDEVSEMSI